MNTTSMQIADMIIIMTIVFFVFCLRYSDQCGIPWFHLENSLEEQKECNYEDNGSRQRQ